MGNETKKSRQNLRVAESRNNADPPQNFIKATNWKSQLKTLQVLLQAITIPTQTQIRQSPKMISVQILHL